MTVEEMVEIAAQVEGRGPDLCTYTREELSAIASVLVKLPQYARIVEIGTFAGRSASLYFQLYGELQFDIHLVDDWTLEGIQGPNAFVKTVCEKFFGVPFTLHRMHSDYCGKKWVLPIDFLHIDGTHQMEGIRRDCWYWLPHVISDGGIVAFHDSQERDVAACIQNYVKDFGWKPIGEAGKTTIWRKIDD